MSLLGQPSPRIAPGRSPILTMYPADRRVLGTWKWASLVIACRVLSSIDPETSPWRWTMQRFMKAAAMVAARASYRPPITRISSGFRRWYSLANSTTPNPTDFAIVAGVDPSSSR